MIESMEAKLTPIGKGSGAVAYQTAALLVFVVLGSLIYSNTLNDPFVFDDLPHIQHNSHIRLTELTLKDIIAAGFKSCDPYRPVANISFALNYYFHKYNVISYHCTNITIHILTAIFLYLFISYRYYFMLRVGSLIGSTTEAGLGLQVAFFQAYWLSAANR